MPNYRRARAAGGTFFFTVVTLHRRPVLTHPTVRQALRTAVRHVRAAWPFSVDAWVLLPDHMHCLWTLPDGDAAYSERWAAIKRAVTQACGIASTDGNRLKRKEGGLWQRRFWEHQIRDEDDFRRHVEYTYWNPVKHGYVSRVVDWPYSTFHRDVQRGLYAANWGGLEQAEVAHTGDFGEPL